MSVGRALTEGGNKLQSSGSRFRWFLKYNGILCTGTPRVPKQPELGWVRNGDMVQVVHAQEECEVRDK